MNTFTIFSNSKKITDRLLELGFHPKKSKLNIFEISTREKPRDFWLLNIAGKTVNQILRQARAGQSVKIRTTEKPQNPHTNF